MLCLLLLTTTVLAQEQRGTDNEPQQGADVTGGEVVPESELISAESEVENEDEIQGEAQMLTREQMKTNVDRVQVGEMLRERIVARAGSPEELKEMVQMRMQEMNQEMVNVGAKQKEMYENQNKVRLAVHSFLAMENLTGGIGKQVSEIARNFDNSIEKTIQAEEKIEKRSGFAKFFIGGDKKAAEELETQVVQNKEKIQELKQLSEECTDCDEAVKEMMQEQIQNMDEEQIRLESLATTQKSKKGLLGWIWK